MDADNEDDIDELDNLPGEDEDGDEDDVVLEDKDDSTDEDDNPPGPDEDETQPRPDPVEVQPSRQRRSQTRWQARERELSETRQRAAEAEARANQLASERQREEAQRQHALQNEREARRAAMLPEERLADELGELRAQINYQRQMDQFYRGDAEDRAQYSAKASVNKTYKRYATEVETKLKQSRANGWNIPREEILANIVGKAALGMAEQSSKPKPTHRKSVSKPVNSRGDGASTQGRRGSSSDKEALRKRLENLPL
jgi:hypothetical protein